MTGFDCNDELGNLMFTPTGLAHGNPALTSPSDIVLVKLSRDHFSEFTIHFIHENSSNPEYLGAANPFSIDPLLFAMISNSMTKSTHWIKTRRKPG